MPSREGNLDAPTRHPVDWRNPDFYNEESLFKEMERIFDICHGCRRCVSLCGAFPTLFDLVDNSKTMEVDGVAKHDFWKVVDQCYLCDLCFMTKCPYVPPHPWNVDFPKLMLRGKAKAFEDGKTTFRDRILTSTDRLGKLATIPVVVQAVNKASTMPSARRVMDKVLGVAAEAALPPYAAQRFLDRPRPSLQWPVRNGARAPGKVALFATCYINYNEPGIGHDLLKILAHNEIPYTFVESESCCGMPKLELGDFGTVEKLKNNNIPLLVDLARAGYAVLTPVPSCTLMFKQELPLIFPDDPDVQEVADAMFDPFEYFVLRDKDGLLKRDFNKPLGKINYHIPCHARVQNVGQKTRELLEQVPDTTLSTTERCSGHDGTWGIKSEFYADSMKIGRPVFRRMNDGDPDYVTSDCPIAGRRILEGIAKEGNTRVRKEHPLTLLRMAYGLPGE